MSFPLFLIGFLEKWTKREQSGQLRGSFIAAKDPQAAARPRGKVGPASGSQRSSAATPQ